MGFSSNDDERAHRAQLAQALAALKEMRGRLEGVQRRQSEPIAIIGMACRFPGGASSPEAFWDLLESGEDAVSPVPSGRFSEEDRRRLAALDLPGTKWGGFLDGVDQFDPSFFGIAPREAVSMDPQQRLFLEVAWESLEDSGVRPDRLAGSRAAVYVGVHSHSADYYLLQSGSSPAAGGYVGTGTGHDVIAGRLSYLLDLRGPSMAVDTACSSSLVAVHLACQSLRAGESDLCLAGGVNLLLSPEFSLHLASMDMLSPDGRCRAFDDRANGFVRGEGCGVVVLKRLADAVAGGDRILALIRGSAVNQDGRTNGLTAPSGLSQQAVIREALAKAGVEPASVSYVEAHGTGTALGDPIEVEALEAVLGKARPGGQPCLLGSAKSNIGHLEGAAGIAGLIKTVLSLRHQAVPAVCHFRNLNPNIPLGTALEVPTETRPWRGGDQRRYAGVSSFSWSGTNAHVVLEEAPRGSSTDAGEGPGRRSHWVLPLSAHDAPTLRALAGAYERFLGLPSGEEGPSLADICHTAGVRRQHHALRLAVTGSTRPEVASELKAFLGGEARPWAQQGKSKPGGGPAIAFVYSGQGPQWWGMGRRLLEREEVFRSAVEGCADLFAGWAGWDLMAELRRDEAESRLDSTELAQPAVFAVQVGLTALWDSWGIAPDAVTGHSMGEAAAAHAAGALSLEDAARVIFHRSRLMHRARGRGMMVAAEVAPSEAPRFLSGCPGAVCIAAVNSPDSTVFSGDAHAVRRVIEALEKLGITFRVVSENYAFHSPHMTEYQPELLRCLDGIRPQRPSLPIYSTVTGNPAGPGDFGPEYWVRNLREPVLFSQAVDGMLRDGHDVFVEIGPHPVLSGMVAGCAAGRGVAARTVACLRRGQDDCAQMAAALGGIYAAGGDIEWSRVQGGGRHVSLPAYPWQRERHWIDSRPGGSARVSLPGTRLRAPLPIFEARLGLDALPYLRGHRLHGTALLPASVYLETARAAAKRALGPGEYSIEDVTVHEALALEEESDRSLQVVLEEEGTGRTSVRIFSAPAAEAGEDACWTLHASGLVRPVSPGQESPRRVSLSGLAPTCTDVVGPAEFYGALERLGLEFRSEFQAVQELRCGSGEAVGRVCLTTDAASGIEPAPFHPALLDGCLQLVLAASRSEDASLRIFVGAARYRVTGQPHGPLWCHARVREDPSAPEMRLADLDIFDEEGRAAASLEGVRLFRAESRSRADWFYQLAWEEKAAPAADGGRALAQIESLARGYAARALAELGLRLEPGASFEPSDLFGRLGVSARHRRLFDRMLGMLEEDGVLERAGEGWRVSRRPRLPTPEQAAAVADSQPAHRHEFGLLVRCGERLAEVLRGDCDALELLFPADAEVTAATLYRDAVSSRFYNELVGKLVTRAARAHRGGSLRILEVGAGTGATAACILERLPPGELEYVFTDVSRSLLSESADRLREYGFVRYEVFDVEADPVEQGFSPGEFDLVVGANVLHATRDLRRSLAHLRSLLKDDGLLLLLESPARRCWLDLTFGLTKGWWRFADTELRASHPLLGERQWLNLLSECGFGGGEAVGASRSRDAVHEQVIFAARPRVPAAPNSSPPQWLILADGSGFGERVAERLRARGQDSVLVKVGPDRPGGMDPSLPGEYERVLTSGDGPWRGILHLWSLDVRSGPAIGLADLERAETLGCASVLHLAQALRGRPAELWIVTRNAQPVDPFPDLSVAQAPVWGLGRGFALEHPESWGGLIDIDGNDPEEDAERVAQELCEGDGEDQVALRGARRFVARLVSAPKPPAGSVRLRPDATYLITGGLGGLGRKLARWMAERGARHLVLVGRSGVPDRARWASLPESDPAFATVVAIRDAERLGATVSVERVDAGDHGAMAALFERIRTQGPPLAGVIHAATKFEFRSLLDMDLGSLRDMLRPKVRGGWILHELTRDLDLDFFILFSSAIAQLGAKYGAHYAAANEGLDALAQLRHASGLPATSINWGAWDETRGITPEQRAFVEHSGLVPMDSAAAIEAMSQVAAAGVVQRTVARIDGAVLRASFEAHGRRPLLGRIRAGAPEKPAQRAAELRERLLEAPPAERRGLIARFVTEEVARVLGTKSPEQIDPERGLFDMGMDSLMAVQLRSRLEAAFGRSLPRTLTFNFPTVVALTGYLSGSEASAAPTGDRSARAATAADEAPELEDVSDREARELLMQELRSLPPELRDD